MEFRNENVAASNLLWAQFGEVKSLVEKLQLEVYQTQISNLEATGRQSPVSGDQFSGLSHRLGNLELALENLRSEVGRETSGTVVAQADNTAVKSAVTEVGNQLRELWGQVFEMGKEF